MQINQIMQIFDCYINRARSLGKGILIIFILLLFLVIISVIIIVVIITIRGLDVVFIPVSNLQFRK